MDSLCVHPLYCPEQNRAYHGPACISVNPQLEGNANVGNIAASAEWKAYPKGLYRKLKNPALARSKLTNLVEDPSTTAGFGPVRWSSGGEVPPAATLPISRSILFITYSRFMMNLLDNVHSSYSHCLHKSPCCCRKKKRQSEMAQ